MFSPIRNKRVFPKGNGFWLIAYLVVVNEQTVFSKVQIGC